MTLERKRKTKDPCPVCFLNKSRCVCAFIPKLTLKTRLCLVVHAKELKRTTNTGRLAIEALVNSEMRIRGADQNALDLSDLLTPQYRTVMFYPADDARELTAEFVAEDPRPIQLIVPDGNWRQASKVHYRHHELKDVPRVMIKTPNQSPVHMRAENTPEGMATLQAIAEAIGIIEGDAAKEPLMKLYRAKLEGTLQGRGIKPDHF
ncbi:tRNA-uridine aminocarboxypropyltransferase [Bdellovibrio sp. KM01]|uniref:tRNA-uridine aminocarboxypropyltransferase n=1 Tax=Bdellovibrio sp. KM01 TaxID=2748865 RepID=UPI0015E930D2|nr:tRNA-uridine aminocarboxypropyltransferase [Bdellovibrio sp. KM01]QLY26496.1 DTW domain-containing protein [Bdellovibrio sp. KM01]